MRYGKGLSHQLSLSLFLSKWPIIPKFTRLGLVWIFFLSLITHHSIFITHHSSLKIPQLPTQSMFGTITQLVITQNFQLFVGPTPVTWCSFYFLSFFLQPLVPKLTEPSEKKKNPETQTQWKKKKKKKKTQKPKPSERRRRKKKKKT